MSDSHTTLEKLAKMRFDAMELAVFGVIMFVLGAGLGRLLHG